MKKEMNRFLTIWAIGLAVVCLSFGAHGRAAEKDCNVFISCGNPYDCCNNGTQEQDGNCTWWAWKMMYDRWGYRAPTWHNAGQVWLDGAQQAGLPTGDGNSPRVGSVFVQSGHVGWVFKVDGNTIYTTQMNCGYPDQYTSEQNDYKTYDITTQTFLGFIYPPDGSGPVPDTGVTKCYDTAGNVIICPDSGEDYYGQDGNYTINPPSYTKLDSQGYVLSVAATSWAMVLDNVTGLYWEAKQNKDGASHYDNPHDADNTYNWYDAQNIFIKALNDANFGGHCDWRLPTNKELAFLVDYSIAYPGPTINMTYFANTVSSYYWSSTTYANTPDDAWLVDFYDGYRLWYCKSYSDYVRAVRGGQ